MPGLARLPEYAERVLEVVERIPPGHVLTYGEVARLVGSGGPRGVGLVMSRYGSGVPWWRVLRAGGHPPLGHERSAYANYVREGTPLRGIPTVGGEVPAGYRVDLSLARWRPPGDVVPP
ncbi:MAG: MGMT family protein [Dermatophilaceae bacterium]